MSCENSNDANGGNGSTSVRRSLFGNVDHEQIKDDLNRQLALISQEKRQQWNFDFENFHPLPPGRYRWERVGKRLEHVQFVPPAVSSKQTQSCTTASQYNTSSQLDTTSDLQLKEQRYNLRNRGRELQNESGRLFKPITPATAETIFRETVPLRPGSNRAQKKFPLHKKKKSARQKKRSQTSRTTRIPS